MATIVLPPSTGAPLEPDLVDAIDLGAITAENVQTTILPSTDLLVSNEVGYVGMQGPAGSSSITGSQDGDMTMLADGSILVYSSATEKWTATLDLVKQSIECGQY